MQYVLCILAFVFMIACEGQIVREGFEFETVEVNQKNAFWVWRSRASNLKTLHVVDRTMANEFEFQLCINPLRRDRNVTLSVANLIYSNDGPFDYVIIKFNNVSTPFQTFAKWGAGTEWNKFHHTGKIGRSVSLGPGKYTLSVSVSTDEYGVEFDRLELIAYGQNRATKMFCGVKFTQKQ